MLGLVSFLLARSSGPLLALQLVEREEFEA